MYKRRDEGLKPAKMPASVFEMVALILKYFLTFLLSIGLIYFGSLSDWQAKERRHLIPPPENLQYFTLGYNESLADSLWIRVLQDFDFCEQTKLAAAQAPAQDQAPTQDEALAQATNQTPLGASRCRSGWVFRMIDTITDLAPRFGIVYRVGSVSLSVLVDDREGATKIFEKGLRQFPERWDIPYRAAYHYLYEMNDPDRAADLLVKAGKNGAPAWVFSLAAKLHTEGGRAILAKSILQEALLLDPPERMKVRIINRLREVDQVISKDKSLGLDLDQ